MTSTLGNYWLESAAWPTRTVRIFGWASPGSASDVGARTYAEKLSEAWRQPVIVENKPGADGILAVRALLDANDGHTLLYSSSVPYTTNIFTHDALPYRVDDLLPISMGAWDFLGLATSPQLPVSSLSELRDQARARAGSINWTAFPGSPFIFMTGFLRRYDLDMNYVPYISFNTAMIDLRQGRIDLAFVSLALILPQLSDGGVRLIAVSNSRRAHSVPEIRTVAEQGEPELTIDGFHGFFAAKPLAAEVRARIADDIQRAALDRSVQDRFQKIGLEADARGAEDFKAKLDHITRRMGPLVHAYGARPKR